MVWCCGPMEALTSEWNTVTPKQTDNASSGYPGRRQFARTEGNALIAAVPVLGGVEGNNDLVSVTVPEGIAPGQTIAVLAPDGSRLVKATIPPGLKAGDSFLVRLATPIPSDTLHASPLQPPAQAPVVSAAAPNSPNFANALDTYMTPAPNHPHFANALENWTPPTATAPEKPMAEAVATPIQNERSDPVAKGPSTSPPASNPTPRQQQQVLGQAVNAQIEVAETRQEPEAVSPMRSPTPQTTPPTPAPPAAPQQKLLLVHVPQGLPAGSTMQVEVPGENRTLSAQVPAGVSSFHVAYTPRPTVAAPVAAPTPTPPPQRTPSPPLAPQPPQQRSSGQRLLLVRVPPGTQAGTTLHVSVPDEPGRILAAQVPPGNVQEFHVSYEARPPATQRGTPFAQPPSYYNTPQQQQTPNTGYYPQHSGNYIGQQQHRMAPPYNGYNERPQNNGGMGNLMLPFLGGAALGAAGVATYDHFAHNDPSAGANAAADPNDYGAADYGGDYGGADYGDYDMGGGDYGF